MVAGGWKYSIYFTNVIKVHYLYTKTYKWPGAIGGLLRRSQRLADVVERSTLWRAEPLGSAIGQMDPDEDL